MPDVTRLKTIELFKKFDEPTLACLAPALEEKRFKDRQVIFKEDDAGAEMYFIGEGEVEILKMSGHRTEEFQVLSVLGKGEFFGEMALIDKEPRSATARAKGNAVLFRLGRREFNGFLATDTRVVISILEGLLATVVRRLREMDTGFVTIHETGRLLASEMDTGVLLGGILNKVMAIVPGGERGFIALWEEFNERFEIRSIRGFANNHIALPKNDPVIRWLKEHKEALSVTADVFQKPVFSKETLPDYYGVSFMAQPFIHHGEMLGFFALSNASRPLGVNREQANLLSGIASQIAPVIANAKKITEDENRQRLQRAKQFPRSL